MDWTVNPKHPRTTDAAVALYGLRWTYEHNGRQVEASNAWPSKATAEWHEQNLIAKGRTVIAKRISYCGGFAGVL